MVRDGRRSVWLLNLCIALALALLVNFSFFITGSDMRGHRPPSLLEVAPWHITFQVLYAGLLAFVLVSLNTVQRFSLGRKILFSLLVVTLFYCFTPTLTRMGEWSLPIGLPRRLYNPMHMMKCGFIVIVAILYGQIYALIYQKQHMKLENEQLKNENLQTRYNMLANQISPHFLFNSLNSLAMLVREKDNDKALLYIDRLADTFRYMLQSGQGELTSLEAELRFTEAYLYLLMIRYEHKFFCEMQIDPQYHAWQLPVLSLQPLIENAVKHNTITLSHPFRMTIRTEGEAVVVSNPLIPRIEPHQGTGIGLKNLASRYQLLTGQTIEIEHTSTEFSVRLPLLQHPTPSET